MEGRREIKAGEKRGKAFHVKRMVGLFKKSLIVSCQNDPEKRKKEKKKRYTNVIEKREKGNRERRKRRTHLDSLRKRRALAWKEESA